MSTDLDLDIAALVGEMKAPPCENAGHGKRTHAHDGGPATHYVRVLCHGCRASVVKAYCAKFVQMLQRDVLVRCNLCGRTCPSVDTVTILGPVVK